MTTISTDLEVSSDRNVYSAIVNASCNATESYSALETLESDIAVMYADISNSYAVTGNAIQSDDCTDLDNADEDDVSALSAENSKDSNALSQGLSTYTSWMDRVSSMQTTVSTNLSNVFSITQSVLNSLSSIISTF